ncbi:MAG: hypothetical protein MJZ90_12045 [Bacteroidales bacterium]|nr:hypothetical protein [Bacteroidales bacterium]
MSKLNTALKAVATFTFQNTDSNASKRLCLFPGHFDTIELVSGTRGSATVTKPVYSNISHITDAGYNKERGRPPPQARLREPLQLRRPRDGSFRAVPDSLSRGLGCGRHCINPRERIPRPAENRLLRHEKVRTHEAGP